MALWNITSNIYIRLYFPHLCPPSSFICADVRHRDRSHFLTSYKTRSRELSDGSLPDSFSKQVTPPERFWEGWVCRPTRAAEVSGERSVGAYGGLTGGAVERRCAKGCVKAETAEGVGSKSQGRMSCSIVIAHWRAFTPRCTHHHRDELPCCCAVVAARYLDTHVKKKKKNLPCFALTAMTAVVKRKKKGL